MSDETTPRPDQVDGAAHPKETTHLFGQERAEAEFLSAFNSGRLHHGWLLSGPRGIGKATLAWRIARFLLTAPEDQSGGLFGETAGPSESLDVSPDHPVARRLLAGAEPRFYHITRSQNEKTGRLRDRIVAEDVRDLNGFLHLSAADGGRRVVLLDCADEMNPQAANALLKMLEEPPDRTVFLLISHQPAKLLPTIKSRCRELRLVTLSPDDIAQALSQAGFDPGDHARALAELSGGSAGEAIRLLSLDGLEIYGELVEIASAFPALDRQKLGAMATKFATRGSEAKLDLLFVLVDIFLARLATAGATGQPPNEAVAGEAPVLSRLSPGPEQARIWATVSQEISARARHGRSVNLDPAALVLDTVHKLRASA